MHFCSECGNMLYIKLALQQGQEDDLVYYCRKCGNETKVVTEDNICVSKTHIKKSKQKIHNMINKYTKYDPTLPRVSNIKCPNTQCLTNQEEDAPETEIIYMRYDDINMKYIFSWHAFCHLKIKFCFD